MCVWVCVCVCKPTVSTCAQCVQSTLKFNVHAWNKYRAFAEKICRSDLVPLKTKGNVTKKKTHTHKHIPTTVHNKTLQKEKVF